MYIGGLALGRTGIIHSDILPTDAYILKRVNKYQIWHRFSTPVAFAGSGFETKQDIGIIKQLRGAPMTDLAKFGLKFRKNSNVPETENKLGSADEGCMSTQNLI